ncbi:MAG: HNH endonuclease [Candidatus Omnitrophota bacterium]
MLSPGDVITYLDMCRQEGVNLQRGMNFRLKGGLSVILMSLRKNAPYADRVEDDGNILIYEGHDTPRYQGLKKNPKQIDQPILTPSGALTENGKFFKAAEGYKKSNGIPELVKVYEKIRNGIWTYTGIFKLIDAWQEPVGKRKVFKFKLKITNRSEADRGPSNNDDLNHTRVIPTEVKLTVWERDKGRCVVCRSANNLHFDHIIPFSKGGTSLKAENIQLMCARHNLDKKDKII